MSSRSCVARSRGQGSGRRIGRCSPLPRSTCHALRRWFSLRRARCSAGIERWCAGSGDDLVASADDRRCRLRFGSSCCASRARIRAGVTAGSAVSWPSWASISHRRASADCLRGRGWILRPGAPGLAGVSSCAPRRQASSRAISSRLRASSCAATTRCSSSPMTAAAFGSPAARPTPPAVG